MLKNRTPSVSVIMPVYNAEGYVKKSVESILNQTEENLELIIVDDCGTDNSMEIIRQIDDSRIEIVSNFKTIWRNDE